MLATAVELSTVKDGTMATNNKPADTRTPSQIKADLAAARARMVANVTDIVEDVHPQAVKERTIDDAKAFAFGELENAKSMVKTDAGWRNDRLAKIGGIAVGVLVLLLTVRKIRNRNRS